MGCAFFLTDGLHSHNGSHEKAFLGRSDPPFNAWPLQPTRQLPLKGWLAQLVDGDEPRGHRE